MEILLTIIGAVLGVLFSGIAPAIKGHILKKRAKDIVHTWESSWQPKNDDSDDWISERVKIENHFGGYKLTNIDNTLGYQWEAEAELVNGRHIIGKWHSIKKGANSKGSFMLTVSPQGDYLFGYFAGPNDEGAIRTGKWVMGRDDSFVEKAKTWLGNHT